MKALVIEDDPSCAEEISRLLRQNGIVTEVCHSGEEGLNMLDCGIYDVVLVDMTLPDIPGNEVIERIRSSLLMAVRQIAIIVLTAEKAVDVKIASFYKGADDYLTKPYYSQELILRVLISIRRAKGHPKNIIELGEIKVDLTNKEVVLGSHKVNLTGKEFELLLLLLMNKGDTLSKENIISSLYYDGRVPTNKVVDVLIFKIREKFARYTSVKYIQTVWGCGYKICEMNEVEYSSDPLFALV